MSFRKKFIKGYLSDPDLVYIDVRSEGAFAGGHIPGSVKAPILEKSLNQRNRNVKRDSQERRAIAESASTLVGRLEGIIPDDARIVVVCSDGGFVSEIARDALKMHYQTFILKEGYRSYRRFVRKCFDYELSLLVLAGKTGSGKTQILEMLEEDGFQVLNLEQIAGSSGSVFGRIGKLRPQPAQEQFENELAAIISRFDSNKLVITEYELQYIGTCTIPEGVYRQISSSPKVLLELPVEVRIKELTSKYAGVDDIALGEAISRLRSRIGEKEVEELSLILMNRDYEQVAARLLRYYDTSESYEAMSSNRSITVPASDIETLYLKVKARVGY